METETIQGVAVILLLIWFGSGAGFRVLAKILRSKASNR